MAIKIERNNLVRFNNRVKKLDNIADNFAWAFVQEAASIAKEKYAGVPELEDLYAERLDYGVYRLVAVGSQLCYLEFGTGTAGELSGYPQDKLPSMTLRFVSRGAERETQGWVYNYFIKNYPNEPDYADWEDMPAGFQMYNTAQELAQRIVEVARNYSKGRKK